MESVSIDMGIGLTTGKMNPFILKLCGIIDEDAECDAIILSLFAFVHFLTVLRYELRLVRRAILTSEKIKSFTVVESHVEI